MANLSGVPTYDALPMFCDSTDFASSSTLDLNFADTFEPTPRVNEPFDFLLSTNHPKISASEGKFFNDKVPFSLLEAINLTSSPSDGNQSYDTGYGSQEEPSSQDPPVDAPHNKNPGQSKTTVTSRKCTNNKNAKGKSTDAEPSKKVKRAGTSSSVKISVNNEKDDIKRKKFLTRNREAASRCRQRKKEWSQDLEEKARNLSSRKQMLTTYVAMLKNELLMLKCKCLEHSDCECESIRDYLKDSINTITPANAILYSQLEDKECEREIDCEESPVLAKRHVKSWPGS